MLASCGVPVQLASAFATDVAQGRAPESSPVGQCVANVARGGSARAALLLADAYQRAMSSRHLPVYPELVEGLPFSVRSYPAARRKGQPVDKLRVDGREDATAFQHAALGLDVFGRQVSWLRLAAERGDAGAQWQLAQAMDIAPYRPMSDMALAWYQTAAENGSGSALAAIASGYSQGRILDERLYDFRKWLRSQPNAAPLYRETARLLSRPAAMHLPG